jgi:hypothetical protein
MGSQKDVGKSSPIVGDFVHLSSHNVMVFPPLDLRGLDPEA